MKYSVGILSLVLATGVMLSTAMPAAAKVVNYVGTCEDQDWFGTCWPHNNWQDDHIPGPGDDAVIDAQYGRVFVDGNATVRSVEAQGGLRLEASSHELHLTSGTSTINGLGLYYNSELVAEAGVTVNLTGNVNLWSHVYGPGRYISNANLNLSYGKLWNQAILEVQTTATITAGSFQLGGDTAVENHGFFTIEQSDSYAEFRGGGPFVNLNSLTFDYTGSTDYYFHADYEQQQYGSLTVQNGTVRLNSIRTDFGGGTVTVDKGAVLVQTSNLGGDQDHRYSAMTSLNGEGWVVNVQEVVVDAILSNRLGTGDASSGWGGYRLSGSTSPMILNADLMNWGRFHLNGGRIEGPSDVVNEGGWFYTDSTGGGTIACGVLENRADVQLGSGITLVSPMLNFARIYVVGGNINGTGRLTLHNGSRFTVNMGAIQDLCSVSTPVTIKGNPTIRTTRGHLHLTQYPVDGVDSLSNGEWIAEEATTIKFSHTITELTGAVVRGKYFRFPNVLLSAIRNNSTLRTDDWHLPGDLDLIHGNVEIETDGRFRINYNLHSLEGSRVGIEDGGKLEVKGETNNGTGKESVVPELCGIAVLTKAARNPHTAAVITPLLNNHGRILPGDYDGVGTLQLNGNLVQHPAGELWINLYGTVPGSEHGQLTIDGDAALGGNLTVTTLPGFVPEVGQQFTILTTTGLRTGEFETVDTSHGHSYSLIYSPNSVVLVVEGVGHVEASSFDLPESPGLSVPFPNPFNPSTTIEFTIDRPQRVNISVFNMSGRRIDVLTERTYSSGSHAITWDGRNSAGQEVSSGTYVIRMRTQDRVESKKVVLLR
jgi:hypothetical protein